MLAPSNHAEYAATVLQPYVSRTTHWIIKQHSIFAGYYFFHPTGRDRNMREQFRGHPAFDATAEFCEWDQAAFDPDYDTLPLEVFEPMVRRVFARAPWSVQGPPLQE
ncbi:hypothetical protein H8B02_43625 [Bradyrhizobium sp. Pear77]|uniref:hypothetical protein n=1 Tax=Bradyrhizobium altum TaxID=1571202 RepID=UPI001E36B8BC|nr:hypothetical protein [Bradyrhizobium altum]MCC8960054.1 hypothetical protein [Bradyrhizobium altum]